MPKYIKTLPCRICNIKATTIFQIIKVCITQLYTFHLILLRVERAFKSMATFLYSKSMPTRNICVTVVFTCLVFRIAVLLT